MDTAVLIVLGAILLLLGIGAVLIAILWRAGRRWKRLAIYERSKRAVLEDRFATVVDADREAERVLRNATDDTDRQKNEAESVLAELTRAVEEYTRKLAELGQTYAEKHAVYDRLVKEVATFDDQLAFAEMGVYAPHFDFDTSEEYKAAINVVRDKQKELIQQKAAVVCHTQWSVDGSQSKGKTMIERATRLTLRAFNGECDAAIANIRWNNANAMEKRIETARGQIDKHNASNHLEITNPYFLLKIGELRLAHEYREKVKAEREERAELGRAAKEEEKLARETERAEAEEARYQRMLEQARSEAASVVGPRLEAYSQQIAILERDLAEAHAKTERARAMAEMTRSGYVYVISNIGSFGPNLVKIGLTRRLDPADRIRELGDASVPFLFDTHAVIYSDDAPALERALHGEFMERRVNATNMRKEFFRVSIEEVEAALQRLAPGAPFFRDIEAQEYHETLALRNAQLAVLTISEDHRFPSSI